MPRIIVKSGYMKSGTHRSVYVKYIATRDGVEIHTSSSGHLKATKKQERLIEQLLVDYPDSETLFEYEDYINEPTRGKASELISTIMEFNLETIVKKENYVGYIANRPRVERIGEHGMFSSTDEVINLNEVAKEVKEHEGNVWTHIISLTREDATRLGYDKAENWKQLCRAKTNEIAQAMKIDPTDLKWYGAYHDEGHHPHVHMIVYSSNPKTGYLTKNGINKMRSTFANEIFKQDLVQIYKDQTEARDTLKKYSKELVSDILQKMNGETIIENALINTKILELKKVLENYHGRPMYAYIPKPAKQIVNDILREIEREPRIKQLYEQWLLYKQDIHQTYSSNLVDNIPLLEQKEFKSIKNMILKEVINSDISNITFNEVKIENDDIVYEPQYIDDASDEDVWEGDSTDEDDAYNLEWSDEYKEAVQYFYGSKTIEQNLEIAERLLNKECNKNNILAFELIAKLYELQGEVEVANEFYTKALLGSEYLLESDSSEFVQSYLHYKVGKFHFYGLGTKQDYEKARKHFEDSANQYADYSLGSIYERGLGVEQSNETAFYYFEKSANKGNAYACYNVAQYLEKGTGTEINIEKSKEYYKKAYQGLEGMLVKREDDNVLYRLGMMNYYGKGVDKNIEQALHYLEKAVALDNEHAKVLLASIYLQEDEYGKIEEAMTWLKESENPQAFFILGKEYLSGDHVEKDIQQAIHYFTLCEENSYAKYKLGKIYLEEEYYNVDKALFYLIESADMNNQYAQVMLGKIYLEGELVSKDVDKAMEYLIQSESQNNMFAQYMLGKLFLFGKDVPQDKDLAVEYLTHSAKQGNEYAQYLLDHMDDYQNQSLTLLTTRLFHHVSKMFENEIPNRSNSLLGGVDRKLAQKIRRKKIAQGHSAKDHEMR